MRFDINNYKGNYVMHCKTEAEAKDFCKYLDSVGRTWTSGRSYLTYTNYLPYADQTAYFFNEGSYCDVDYYRRMGYTVLEWEDFMNKTFTKADLKTGDVVLRRDGAVCIVIRELETLVSRTGFCLLEEYRSDLTDADDVDEVDIMEVRRPIGAAGCHFDAFRYGYGTLVYKREEVEEMTLEQVCKLLGKNIKIIK